jgi:hypothetical protein
MRATLIVTTALTLAAATAAHAQDSGQAAQASAGESLADSAKVVGTGVRVTAAVVAVPIRIVAGATGAVLKQTFTGLAEGSKADPFADTALQVDNDIVVKAQPAPVVPRQVPAK